MVSVLLPFHFSEFQFAEFQIAETLLLLLTLTITSEDLFIRRCTNVHIETLTTTLTLTVSD